MDSFIHLKKIFWSFFCRIGLIHPRTGPDPQWEEKNNSANSNRVGSVKSGYQTSLKKDDLINFLLRIRFGCESILEKKKLHILKIENLIILTSLRTNLKEVKSMLFSYLKLITQRDRNNAISKTRKYRHSTRLNTIRQLVWIAIFVLCKNCPQWDILYAGTDAVERDDMHYHGYEMQPSVRRRNCNNF